MKQLLLSSIIYSILITTSGDLYPWRDKWRYYFPTLQTKLTEIINPKCIHTVNITNDWIVKVPTLDNVVHAASVPVNKDIVCWWKGIPKPQQMRVDPNLCDQVYSKSRPIFNNTGCQVPAIMNPSAPRCQTKYLKWICDSARLSIDDKAPNHFVIPESNHNTTDLPPHPWILTARNAVVSMCGHISFKCGLVHTTANCMSTGQKLLSKKFAETCSINLMGKVSNSA
jgi:hypothetical protein